MTDWAGFVGFAGVVLTLMLVLAWLSRDAISAETVTSQSGGDEAPAQRDDVEEAKRFNRVMGGPAPGPGEPDPQEYYEQRRRSAAEATETESESSLESVGDRELSTGTLLANVVLTQGLFLCLLVIGLWWTQVPVGALGLAPAGLPFPGVVTAPPGVPDAATALGWSPTALAIGVGLGLALYVFNQLGAAVGNRVGIDSSTDLREALAPASAEGWAGLLGIVLPVVAVFEELLFRGVLIGGLLVAGVETGVPVSPWLLVVGSSVAFALGHGAQGRGGIAVTGGLGAVLGVAFVLTWSLPLVIVAHYVVNAVEFVIHEGFGIDWI